MEYQDEIHKLENIIINQLEEKNFLEYEFKLLKCKTIPALRDRIHNCSEKIVPESEFTVPDIDKFAKTESEESVKLPFSVSKEVIEYILEQVTESVLTEVSKYDTDELKIVKSTELIQELLNDIIMSVDHSDVGEIKSSVHVTKMLPDEVIESSIPKHMTSTELIVLDVVQHVIDNICDYGNKAEHLEITEEETDFDVIDVTSSSELEKHKTICAIIIEDIINDLPM